MSEAPDTNEHDSPVTCPACGSVNIAARRARDLTYQCRDCGTEFDADSEPLE